MTNYQNPRQTQQTTADVRGVTIGLYGYPGCGKTTCAIGDPGLKVSGMTRPFIISCEDGVGKFAGIEPYHCTGVADFIEAVDWLMKYARNDKTGRPALPRDFPYASVLVDGASRLYELGVTEAATSRIKRLGMRVDDSRNPAASNPQAAHYVSFENVNRQLQRLKALQCPIIFTLHADSDAWPVMLPNGKALWEDGAKVMGRTIRPALSPKMRALFERTVDVLAYAYYDEASGERLFVCGDYVTPRLKIETKDRYGVIGSVPDPERPHRRLLLPRPMEWASFAEPLRELATAGRIDVAATNGQAGAAT